MSRLRLLVPILAVIAAYAQAQGASAAVVGVQQAGQSSAMTSANKGATVTCPAGKKVVGAGVDVTPGLGEVVIDDVRPGENLQSVTVFAREKQGGSANSWFVEARATCAYAPPGLQKVTATSASNSSNKSIVATCPGGKRLLGTGAEIDPGDGQVSIGEVTPDAALTKVTVKAFEDEDGTAASWALKAYAICANPIAGAERVTGFSAQNSNPSRVIETPCPTGKRVLGSGGSIHSTANLGQFVLDAMFTNATSTGSGFAAFEDASGTTALWHLAVYGICVPAVERVDLQSADDSSNAKAVEPHCASGQRRLGVGFDIVGAAGQAWPYRMALKEELFLNIFEATEDNDGYGSDWYLLGHSICSTPLAGEVTVEEIGPLQQQVAAQSVTVTCPPGTKVVGAGGWLSGNTSVVQGLVPEPDLENVTFRSAASAFTETNFEVISAAQAECATPPPGLELVTARTASTTTGFKEVSAQCPAGKHVTGTGAETINAYGHAVLDQIEPDPALTRVTAAAHAAQSVPPGNWWLRVFAVCINR